MSRIRFVVVFFVCLFPFLVQADRPEGGITTNVLFDPGVLSGEQEKIEQVVKTWTSVLLSNRAWLKFYPSGLKKESDFNRFFQLLKTADKERTDSVLIEIADVYLSSANKIYRRIFENNPFYQRSGLSSVHEFSMFFDYSVEEQRMAVMMREYYIALVFLSLAGFSSSYGKERYIAAIERVQTVYDSFVVFSKQFAFITRGAYRSRFLNSPPERSVGMGELFTGAIEFNGLFNRIRDYYRQFIVPSFMGLSWVKHDVQNSGHPEVLFRYGLILHKTYGEKGTGLTYISASVEQGHLPAIKYLGEYYLRQEGRMSYHAGEQLMMDFLGSSAHLMEKLRVIHELYRVNRERGSNVMDSFQRGVSSIRRSCFAAFGGNR